MIAGAATEDQGPRTAAVIHPDVAASSLILPAAAYGHESMLGRQHQVAHDAARKDPLRFFEQRVLFR
ncbi:MAG: hypothetical protein U5K43_10060 [Halofilum sp. (in: g-proteobacteria)]|nr:hypothetical protein [Halofilum sp. (in: g-proteobacteria)]